MFITNAEEIIPVLRTRLNEYLVSKGVKEHNCHKFSCFIHQDDTPSMVMNPKTNFETAHCFGCGVTIDIFGAAARLEQLPEAGPEWMTVTIPTLAKQLEIPIEIGEPSPQDREKLKLYKLANDIDEIIHRAEYINTEYMNERHWESEDLKCSTISEETLTAELIEKGWTAHDINTSLLVSTSKTSFFGTHLATFTIKNDRGQPIGFVSRNLGETGPKYINTTESVIFEKRKTLMGLDTALKSAKQNGLYIVEGAGDRAQLMRLGITNVAATLGTAFTPEHVALLRMHGIKDVYFCFDWDQAGAIAIDKVFKKTLREASGLSCWVVEPPPDMGNNTDPDSYLFNSDNRGDFLRLSKTSAFEWMMRHTSDNADPLEICERMIPVIASESTNIRRELLIKQLVEFTGISYQSIYSDVMAVKDRKHEERKERLAAAAEKYRQAVMADPDNILSAMAQHEYDIELIEKDYQTQHVGSTYQLARYDAIQEMKKPSDDGIDRTAFKMNYFTDLAAALGGGMIYTTGTVMYFGGRANSGKTATVIMVGLDVALSDPDTIVLMHYTDDSLMLIEPRLKTNVSMLISGHKSKGLTIGMAANPYNNVNTADYRALYNLADQKLREMLAEEKLILIDSEDGATLSTLERYVRYIRRKYPQKKLLVICDNTYNYMDFGHMGQTDKIMNIANAQKNMMIKYHACMMATAEYRKNQAMNQADLKLPVNDDLADSRAMTYRSNAIIHVYNDVRDRGDHAEFFWTHPAEPDVPKPRLLLVFGKNKITKFDRTLYADLDGDTVTLKQVDPLTVKRDYINYKENETAAIINGRLIVGATEWNDGDSN